MYLDKIIIEYISREEIVYTWRVQRRSDGEQIRADQRTDIDQDRVRSGTGAGTAHIYNDASYNIIEDQNSPEYRPIQSLSITKDEISFSIAHQDIELDGTLIYNLILPPRYKLNDYDFIYDYMGDYAEVLWDTENEVSIIRVQMQPRKEKITFSISGVGKDINHNDVISTTPHKENDIGIDKLLLEEPSEYHILDEKGRASLGSRLSDVTPFLELRAGFPPIARFKIDEWIDEKFGNNK